MQLNELTDAEARRLETFMRSEEFRYFESWVTALKDSREEDVFGGFEDGSPVRLVEREQAIAEVRTLRDLIPDFRNHIQTYKNE